MRTLKSGAKGSDVALWQAFLQQLRHYQAKLDGDFGPATLDATKAFQRANSLGDDGIVGNRTLGLAMQLGLKILSDDPATPGVVSDDWVPPPPPGGAERVVSVDPRIITAHAPGQLPCPRNPSPPAGWRYWTGGVSHALTEFAKSVEFKPADFPIGSFVQAVIEQRLVGARVEWHDFQGATGARGCFRGTSLFRPAG